MTVLLCQSEIQLTFLDIGTGHLDGDRVAQLELMMMAAADKTVVALIKLVVVIVEIVHGHHALTVVLVNLTIDALRLDATDVRRIDIADLVGHELHHLVLDGVALGIGGYLLHVAGVLAQLLVMVLVGTAPSLLVTGEQPVDHRVGIAADGAGEMGIVVEGQTIVADIVNTVLTWRR